MQKKETPVIRILKLLQPHKKTAVLLIVLIVAASLFDILVPFISQRLIDGLINFFKVGGAPPVGFLLLASVAIFILTVLNSAIRSVYNFRLFKLGTGVEDESKHQAFEKYLKLHSLFHHGASSGQIIGRIERGSTAIYIIINDIFGQNLLPPAVVFVGVLIALLFKNPLIALVVFLPLPIYIFAIQRLTGRIYEIEKQANEEFETVAKEAYDVAGNVLTVKKFSQEHAETEEQKRLQNLARETQYSAERLWGVMESVQTFIATAGRMGVILLAGFLVFQGKSTVGEFVLYMTLQNMAYGPISQLSVVFPRLRRNVTRAERLFGILDEPINVVDAPNAVPLPPLKKQIEFRDVGFQYRSGRWSLRNVNVNIPVWSTVALMGRSGSGKTTFVNMILRSFDPQEGGIFIDGRNIREVTQESLRNQIAVVPQEVDLFSRTIKGNIAYGKPNATSKEIIKAAKTALAHNFIMKLEDGYDTVVGERGVKLSGGERQRIGIARAILRDPRILILDEATSHLDTESERLIQKATEAIMKNRTTIIIAHRLSTILDADKILVFHNGQIEKMGRHETLLRTSPTYRRLYNLQFSNA
jgi:ABC-type multidrug transport system fused ATPase/permease subunit